MGTFALLSSLLQVFLEKNFLGRWNAEFSCSKGSYAIQMSVI